MWKLLILLSAFAAAAMAVNPVRINLLQEEREKCERICKKLNALETHFDEVEWSCQCLLVRNAELIRPSEMMSHEASHTTERAIATTPGELKKRLNLEVARRLIDRSPVIRKKRRAINANDNDQIVGFHRPLLTKFRAATPLKHKVIDPRMKKLHFDLKNLAVRRHAGHIAPRTWAKPIAPELRARLAIDKVKHRMLFPGIVGSTATKNTDSISSNQQKKHNMHFRSKSNFDNGDDAPQQSHSSKQIITQPQEFIED